MCQVYIDYFYILIQVMTAAYQLVGHATNHIKELNEQNIFYIFLYTYKI